MNSQFIFGHPKDAVKERCISISDVIGMLAPEFDSKAVAQRTYDKHYNDPESKYYQMSEEEILESWEKKGAESREYGSNLDEYIGLRLTGHPNDVEIFKMDKVDGDERMEGLCESFEKFYSQYIENGPLEYIDREKYVYYPLEIDGEKWYVRGRFDAFFYNTEKNHFVINDWKSNGEIDIKPNRWTKKLYGPAKELYDLSGIKYTIQVFFYKHALEHQVPNEVVDVAITNLPGFDVNHYPQVYVYPAQFKYNKEFMDNIFNYAIKKKKLLQNR